MLQRRQLCKLNYCYLKLLLHYMQQIDLQRKLLSLIVYPMIVKSQKILTYCQKVVYFVAATIISNSMESSKPKTITDLSLDKLKIMFNNRISARRMACVQEKFDLLKYLWKESEIDECFLQKYIINNRDEVSRHDDAFSRYLLDSTDSTIYTGHNEYAKQRLADRIEPIPLLTESNSVDTFAKKKRKIQDLIRSEIGTKWWDLGRHLDIRQGQLDTINIEQNEVARKVDKVFDAFGEDNNCNAVTYVGRISSALIKARRADLAKKVYQIMEH